MVEKPRLMSIPAEIQQRLEPFHLSPREQEILSCLLQGCSNKEIAARCFICEQTVKDHLKHIYGKLGLHRRDTILAFLLGEVRNIGR